MKLGLLGLLVMLPVMQYFDRIIAWTEPKLSQVATGGESGSESREYVAPGVGKVFLIAFGAQAIPVLIMDEGAQPADQAIIQTFYHRRAVLQGGAHPVDLLLSATTVIPALRGNAVAGDKVPAKIEDIAWVKITLVKNVATSTAIVNRVPPETR